jgi:hypothetical protein
MTRVAGAHRERFLPYRYVRGGVELVVSSCVLDAKTRVATDLDTHLVDLDVSWSRAVLTLAVTVSATTHAAIADGAPPSAFELALVTHCPATLLRVARRVPLSALDEPSTVELELRRDDLAGSAQVFAFLVRATDPHERSNAAVRGARVADSRSWELRIDRKREPQGDYLDIRYKKFADDETLPRRDRGNLYVLDLEQEEPILWINADHDRIAGILDSRGAVGRHARLRESFFDHIAYSVWTQLFLKAAGDYAAEGEVTYAWQDTVLELLLRDVFPDVRIASERRARLRDLWADQATLMRRLDAGLQRRNDLAAHLTKLVNEESET